MNFYGVVICNYFLYTTYCCNKKAKLSNEMWAFYKRANRRNNPLTKLIYNVSFYRRNITDSYDFIRTNKLHPQV